MADHNHKDEISSLRHEHVADQTAITQYDYVFKVITIGDPGKHPTSH